MFVGKGSFVLNTSSFALLSNWLPLGKKHVCFYFSSPLSNQYVVYAHCLNYFLLWFCWRLVSALQCCPACSGCSDGLQRGVQEHTHAFSWGLSLCQMELCFHRDQTLCVSRKIFLGAAVQLVEGLFSLIGEQIVTGFLSSQNGFCLFLSHSFLFFPVTYFTFHCRLITHVCSSSLLLHFLYHYSCCARISYHRGVCREWEGPSLCLNDTVF